MTQTSTTETSEDGSNLESSSNTNQEIIYYEEIYKIRLNWTRHPIPVRAYFSGLYIEGYLATIKKPEPDLKVSVKIAYIGTKIPNEIEVSYKDIYPSFRKLKCMGDNQIIDTEVIPVDSQLGILAKKEIVDRLKYLLPDYIFTEDELRSLTNCDKIDKSYLVESGTKRCLITAKNGTTAYKIMPINKDLTVRENLIDLVQEYNLCKLCKLGEERIARNGNLVFGRGNPSAKLMIVAEAPGVQEEQTGIPLFQKAPAGSILFRVMEKVGISQDACYLTNAVICRPAPAEGTNSQNGTPEIEHVQACSTRFKRTLRSVSPKVVVLLGKTSYHAWFGFLPPGGVLANLGEVTSYDTSKNPINYRVFFTYHPSYILRNNSVEVKLEYLEHWKKIKEILNSYE